MIRTTPDPVFAAAAREELERRVREHGPSGAIALSVPFRPRRAWRTEFVAIAGVLALVAGVAAGVTALRPVLPVGGGPVISSTRTPEPQPTSDPTPTLTPTSAPTAPTRTSAPPVAPVTAPPSSTPTRTPTTPVSTPPPVASSGLIAPTGAKQRSEAEIRAYAAAQGNSTIWGEQAVLDTQCMAEKGFLYDVEFREVTSMYHPGLTDAQFSAYDAELYGPPQQGAYDWRTAGCHGRSVHLTGQDDAR